MLKIREPIPFRGLRWSLVILLGVLMMQLEQAVDQLPGNDTGCPSSHCGDFCLSFGQPENDGIVRRPARYIPACARHDACQPAVLVYPVIVRFKGVRPPSGNQIVQSGVVAVFSGVIATVLFFRATDLVRGDMQKLSLVEATQSLEVLFALFGEIVGILPVAAPSLLSRFGILTVAAGMVLHSLMSRKTVAPAAWRMKKSEISG